MKYNLLTEVREANEYLFLNGIYNAKKYFKNENQLDTINELFIINLN